MAKFRKKPVVIDAIQCLREQNISSVQDFVTDGSLIYNADDNEYYVKTIEGNMRVTKGDWIIRGVHGEYYPCKPEIFEKTYELVGE